MPPPKLTPSKQRNGPALSAIWDSNLPCPALSLPAAAAVVFVTAVGCFAHSQDGVFVFDDSEAITGNKDLLAETPLLDLFYHDFWGSRLASNASHKSYRPLTVLTFRLNRYLAGGLHPRGFHIVNILLHGVICVLLLPVMSLLCQSRHPDGCKGILSFGAPRASLMTTLLFAVHPVHTESVAGVVGRADLLCAMCFLLSFMSYIKYCMSGGAPLLLVSMLLCGVSVLCKEQGITVLGICSAYDIICNSRIDLLHLISFGKHGVDSSKKIVQLRPLVQRHIVLLLTGIAILVSRWKIMGSSPPVFQEVDNPHSFVNGTILRVVNYNYLYSMNVWLMLNPWWLCFDWSMGCVPVISNMTDLRILAAVAFWTFMLALVYKCLWILPCKEQRVLLMGLAFIVVPFLPATNLLFRVGFVVAERVLYLPSIGYCLLVISGAQRITVNPGGKKVVLICFVVLLGLYTARSIQRSNEWRSEKLLFGSGAQVCPLNAKVHYNIAKIQADAGHEDYAIDKYRLAIRLNPRYDQAMNNLANILKERNQLSEAQELLRTAVDIRPDFAAAWMNLGIVQASLGQRKDAETSYLTALRHRRKYSDCFYNLGNLYLEGEHFTQALTAWRNATALRPTHTSAWVNMIILLDNLKRLSDVVSVTEEAIRHVPGEATIYYNAANALGKADRYEDSEKYFLKAAQLDPSNSSYQANLGVLYHRWKKYEKAKIHYEKAIQLDPNNRSAIENYNMLLKKLAKTQK